MMFVCVCMGPNGRMNVIVTLWWNMYLSTDLGKEWVRMSGYLISLHVIMCMTAFLYNE